MAERTVIWKAIADFSSITRGAAQARRELEQLEHASQRTSTVISSNSNQQAGAMDASAKATARLGDASSDSARKLANLAEAKRQSARASQELDRNASQAAKSVTNLSLAGSGVRGGGFANFLSQLGNAFTTFANNAGRGTTTMNLFRSAISNFRGEGMLSILSSISGGIASIGAVAVTAADGIGMLSGAIAGLGSGLSAMLGSIGPLVGLLGALPSLAIATAGAFGTTIASLSGVSGAMKAHEKQQKASSRTAATAANQAQENSRKLERAERSLADARRTNAKAIRDAQRGVRNAEEGLARTAISNARAIRDAQRAASKAREDAALTAERAARSIENAEAGVVRSQRSLIDAQKRAVRAQAEVNEARRSAIRRLDDLRRAVKDYALQEEGAGLSLEEARKRLQETLNDPLSTNLERRGADLAVREAEARLEEVRRLSAENDEALADAQKRGIEGSDEVVAAMENEAAANEAVVDAQAQVAESQRDLVRTREEAARSIRDANEAIMLADERVTETQADNARTMRDANEALARANERLADAQIEAAERTAKAQEAIADVRRDATGAAGKVDEFAEAMSNLTPEAQAVVYQLIRMKDGLEEMRKAAERAVLPGFLSFLIDVEKLFPRITQFVTDAGTVMGDFFRQFGNMITTEGAMGRWNKVLDDGVRVMEYWRDGLLNVAQVLGDVATAAVDSGLTKWLGETTVGWTETWAAWTSGVEGARRLEEFFQRTMESADLMGSIIEGLVMFFYNLGDAGYEAGQKIWRSFDSALETFNRWAASEDGAQAISRVAEHSVPLFREMGNLIVAMARGMGELFLRGDPGGFVRLLRVELGPALMAIFRQLQDVAVIENFVRAIASIGTSITESGLLIMLGEFINQIIDLGSVAIPALTPYIKVLIGFLDILATAFTWFFEKMAEGSKLAHIAFATVFVPILLAAFAVLIRNVKRFIVDWVRGFKDVISILVKVGKSMKTPVEASRRMVRDMRAELGNGVFDGLDADTKNFIQKYTTYGERLVLMSQETARKMRRALTGATDPGLASINKLPETARTRYHTRVGTYQDARNDAATAALRRQSLVEKPSRGVDLSIDGGGFSFIQPRTVEIPVPKIDSTKARKAFNRESYKFADDVNDDFYKTFAEISRRRRSLGVAPFKVDLDPARRAALRDAREIAEDTSTTFVRGLNGEKVKVDRAAQAFFKPDPSVHANVRREGEQIAGFLSDGLLIGLRGDQSEVQKGGMLTAEELVEGVKYELGMASPSRVAIKIGGDFTKSLADGVRDERRSVRRAGEAVSDELEKGVNDAELQREGAEAGESYTEGIERGLRGGRNEVRRAADSVSDEIDRAADSVDESSTRIRGGLGRIRPSVDQVMTGLAAVGGAIVAFATIAAQAAKEKFATVEQLATAMKAFATSGDFSAVNAEVKKFGDSWVMAGRNIEDTASLFRAFQETNQAPGQAFKWVGDLLGMDSSLSLITEEIKKLDEALGGMELTDATEAFRKIGEEMTEAGISTQKQVELMPGLAGQVKGLAAELGLTLTPLETYELMMGNLPESVRIAAEANGYVADSFDDLVESVDAGKLSVEGYLEVVTGLMNSEIGLERSIKDTRDAIASGTKTLDLSTEAGQKNWEILNSLIDSGARHIDTLAQAGKSQEEQREATAEARETFEKFARQVGMSEAEILKYSEAAFGTKEPNEQMRAQLAQSEAELLANSEAAKDLHSSLASLTGETKIEVTAPGLSPITSTVGGLRDSIKDLPKDKVITVTMPNGDEVTATVEEIRAGIARADKATLDLANRLRNLPQDQPLRLNIDGIETAKGSLDDIRAKVRDIPRDRVITVTLPNGEEVTRTAGEIADSLDIVRAGSEQAAEKIRGISERLAEIPPGKEFKWDFGTGDVETSVESIRRNIENIPADREVEVTLPNGEVIKGTAGDIKKAVEDIPSTYTTQIKMAELAQAEIDKAKSQGNTLGTETVNGFNAGREAKGSATATESRSFFQTYFIDPIKSTLGISSPSTLFFGFAQDVIAGFWNGISAKATEIKNNVTTWFRDNIETPVKDFFGLHSPSKLFDGFGRDVIAGFWNGIAAKATETKTSVTNWFRDNVETPVKNFFGLHSPSTLFRGFGIDVIQGFMNGMVSMQSRAETTVRNLVDSLGREFDKIKAKFSGPAEFVVNTVYNDGIRPMWNAVAEIIKAPTLSRVNFGGSVGGSATAGMGRVPRDKGGYTGPGHRLMPAGIVHADEFVIRKAARRKFESSHPGALSHINRTGTLPNGYRDGGLVTGDSFKGDGLTADGNVGFRGGVHPLSSSFPGLFLGGTATVPGGPISRHSGYAFARWAGDLARPMGTPVSAWKDGVVAQTNRWSNSYGWHVWVNHPNGERSLYAHLSAINVQPGQQVRAGQRLGAVGSTGNSTGPHLHFEIRGGSSPLGSIGAAAASAAGTVMSAFDRMTDLVTTPLRTLMDRFGDNPWVQNMSKLTTTMANQAKAWSDSKLQAITDSIMAAAAGVAGAAGVPGSLGNIGVTANTARKGEEIVATARRAGHRILTVGGYRGDGEHVTRRALDIMVPNKAAGDFISSFTWANRVRYGLQHIIWWQRIISQARAGEGWRMMANRGSYTQNHMDHPHILFDSRDLAGFSSGGYTGSGPRMKPAGVVHADEFVVKKPSRRKFESNHPGFLDHINRTGEMPGYHQGGIVKTGGTDGAWWRPGTYAKTGKWIGALRHFLGLDEWWKGWDAQLDSAVRGYDGRGPAHVYIPDWHPTMESLRRLPAEEFTSVWNVAEKIGVHPDRIFRMLDTNRTAFDLQLGNRRKSDGLEPSYAWFRDFHKESVEELQAVMGVDVTGYWNTRMQEMLMHLKHHVAGSTHPDNLPTGDGWSTVGEWGEAFNEILRTNRLNAEWDRMMDQFFVWGYDSLMRWLNDKGVAEGMQLARDLYNSPMNARDADVYYREYYEREDAIKDEQSELNRLRRLVNHLRRYDDVGLQGLASSLELTMDTTAMLYRKAQDKGMLNGISLSKQSRLNRDIIDFDNLFRFALGGLVPGAGNMDSVLALLTPGEYVLTKDQTKQLLALQKYSAPAMSGSAASLAGVTSAAQVVNNNYINNNVQATIISPDPERAGVAFQREMKRFREQGLFGTGGNE